MAFFECEFPTTIGYQQTGGPGWSTAVKQGLSGQEQRNGNWANARGEWQLNLMTPKAYEKNPQDFVDLLVAFFNVVGGKRDGFRLKDHKSFRAVQQPVVTNPDGANQLAISHVIGGRTYVQFISKPITSAVVNYKGVALPDTVVGATADPETGLTDAAAGTLVDFQFHYPVRFDVDKIPIMIQAGADNEKPIITVNGLTMVEVPGPNF